MVDDKISLMISMGFDKDSARRFLMEAGGDLEIAIEKALSQGQDHSTFTSGPCRNQDLSHDTEIVSALISQYSLDGRSACTCIALRAASDLLHAFSKTDTPSEIKRLITTECLETIITKGCNDYHCLKKRNKSNGSDDHDHMSAENVLKEAHDCGIFYRLTSICDVRQGILNHSVIGMYQILGDCYQESRLKNDSKWTAVVITKVPETICVFLPPSNVHKEHKFLLLDSHSRPSFGIQGGYVWFCDSLEALVQKISVLFPFLDMGNDNFMSQMYNAFDVYTFQMASTNM
jgi:hypothetical protein